MLVLLIEEYILLYIRCLERIMALEYDSYQKQANHYNEDSTSNKLSERLSFFIQEDDHNNSRNHNHNNDTEDPTNNSLLPVLLEGKLTGKSATVSRESRFPPRFSSNDMNIKHENVENLNPALAKFPPRYSASNLMQFKHSGLTTSRSSFEGNQTREYVRKTLMRMNSTTSNSINSNNNHTRGNKLHYHTNKHDGSDKFSTRVKRSYSTYFRSFSTHANNIERDENESKIYNFCKQVKDILLEFFDNSISALFGHHLGKANKKQKIDEEILELQTELSHIFAFSNAEVYFFSVEMSLLLQVVYIALWATNFAEQATYSYHPILWEIGLIFFLPINILILK